MARATFRSTLLRAAGVLATLLLCAASTPPPPKRIALIIGNSAYEAAVPLPNAKRDAVALSQRLKALGFEVVGYQLQGTSVQASTLDLNGANLKKAIDNFDDELQKAAPNVVAFVYYSGHAAQDDFGVNYMIPVDLDAQTPEAVRERGIPIPPLLQKMEEANNDVNIVVLDACRDWFKGSKTEDDPKGLHDMGLFASVLIAYATRSGATADEGPDLESSPFSRRLIEAVAQEPAVPLPLLFDDVQTKVYADTDALQLPMYVNGLVRAGRWALSSGALEMVSATPRPSIQTSEISPFLQTLDRERLILFARGNVSFVDALLKRRDILEQYGINTPDRLSYFLSSIAFETAGFTQQVEKFGYTAKALRARFPNQVKSDELAATLAGHPENIANLIYGNRLGNGPPESGDGWRYRGRGLFFITGKGNYIRYGKMVGADLVHSPDLVNDLETGIAIAAVVWKDVKANEAADKDDLVLAARRFRGPSASKADLPERKIWLKQARQALEP